MSVVGKKVQGSIPALGLWFPSVVSAIEASLMYGCIHYPCVGADARLMTPGQSVAPVSQLEVAPECHSLRSNHHFATLLN